MKAFIAGATGVLGWRLVDQFAGAGHEVIGLTRDEAGDQTVEEHGGTPVRGDILEPDTLFDAVDDDVDVIIHAATAIPTSTNPSEDEWALNDRIRREGAEHLADIAGKVDAERVLMQSIVWVARPPDGSPFDEESDPHPNRITQSALDAERTVTSRATALDFDPVVLRGGWFYAADTAHTRQIGERLETGDMPIIGGGLLGRKDAPISFIHVDDMARAFLAAAEGSATGTFHVVDDEPTSFADFLTDLADRLGGPNPSRVPGWLARFMVGNSFVRLMTSPMRTSNANLRDAFDWRPTYPTVQDGLDHVVEEWKRDADDPEAILTA